MDDRFFNKIILINLFTISLGFYNRINRTKINDTKTNNNIKN